MATCRDIVERAYRKIGVVATDEAMTAEQAQVGLDALNMMMQGLVLDGIDVGWNDADLSGQFDMEPFNEIRDCRWPHVTISTAFAHSH